MKSAAKRTIMVVAVVACLLACAGLGALDSAQGCGQGAEAARPGCPSKYIRGEAFVITADGRAMVAAAVDRQCGDEWILITAGEGLPDKGGQVRVLWQNPFGQCKVPLYAGTVYQVHCGVRWIAVKAAHPTRCPPCRE